MSEPQEYPYQDWAKNLIRKRQVAKRQFNRPGELSVKQMTEAVLERDGRNVGCYWCGAPFGGGALRRTLEHIIPLSKGGKHELSNCAVAHAKCNHERKT